VVKSFHCIPRIRIWWKLKLTTKFDVEGTVFPIYVFKNYKIFENQIDLKSIFLFDTVRIWEFSPMWTDFDKCHNLSKWNVKLILKVLSDLEPLRGLSNKKTLYSTRSWASFHSRFKMAHACQKRPNLHTNSSNKLLFLS
jgi:hypothetical protein